MKKNILGIHCGHNAGAALMINGKIKFALQEERFVNIKNYTGFPTKSLNYIKNFVLQNSMVIHLACFSSKHLSLLEMKYPLNQNFSIEEFDHHYDNKYYTKKLRGENFSSYFNFLNKKFK